jgi:hypothetical protein
VQSANDRTEPRPCSPPASPEWHVPGRTSESPQHDRDPSAARRCAPVHVAYCTIDHHGVEVANSKTEGIRQVIVTKVGDTEGKEPFVIESQVLANCATASGSFYPTAPVEVSNEPMPLCVLLSTLLNQPPDFSTMLGNSEDIIEGSLIEEFTDARIRECKFVLREVHGDGFGHCTLHTK